ncbi:MAG: hypothetical protein ABR538_03640 [Candidatus Binatia bacterium]
MTRPSVVVAFLFGVVVSLATAACDRPLPEAGSPQAALYAARCNGCHAVFAPASLGPAMWKFQMERMDQKYRAAGAAPPTPEERAQILEYLVRNAGG